MTRTGGARPFLYGADMHSNVRPEGQLRGKRPQSCCCQLRRVAPARDSQGCQARVQTPLTCLAQPGDSVRHPRRGGPRSVGDRVARRGRRRRDHAAATWVSAAPWGGVCASQQPCPRTRPAALCWGRPAGEAGLCGACAFFTRPAARSVKRVTAATPAAPAPTCTHPLGMIPDWERRYQLWFPPSTCWRLAALINASSS